MTIFYYVGLVTYIYNLISFPHSINSLPTEKLFMYEFLDTIRPNAPLGIQISTAVSINLLQKGSNTINSYAYKSYPGDYSDYRLGIIAFSLFFLNRI